MSDPVAGSVAWLVALLLAVVAIIFVARRLRSGSAASVQLAIHEKPGYLHVTVRGRNSVENVTSYIEEIARECSARQCSRILVEERLVGPRLNTFEVFDIVAKGSARSRGLFKAIAYVDVNGAGDLMKFAETVGINRDMPLAVFASVADAEKWILTKCGEDTGPRC
jgi:hypothetical protein